MHELLPHTREQIRSVLALSPLCSAAPMFLLRSSQRYRPAVAVAAVGLFAANERRKALCITFGVPPDVHAELQKLRPNEAAMRQKWEDDETSWHKLPPRAWPPTQPKAHEQPTLRKKMSESCQTAGAKCDEALFELASCLVFGGSGSFDDAAEGLTLYRSLAARGHTEAMVGVGVVLLEGIGHDIDDAEGLHWVQRASDRGSAQGQYELGVLHYLGSNEHVEENEKAAFALFEQCAAQQHTSGLFMMAEFLIEGCGCNKDPARAIPLLLAAAERGHRLARRYLVDWLDEDAEKYPSS